MNQTTVRDAAHQSAFPVLQPGNTLEVEPENRLTGEEASFLVLFVVMKWMRHPGRVWI